MDRINIKDLPKSSINHGTGLKKVFLKKDDTNTALTQIAWACFEPGEYCDMHTHPTMDEYFFVYKGKAKYEVDNEVLNIVEGDFIRIPANTKHKLYQDINDEKLELVYFGIDITYSSE
mgnify:CR=1 FL=1|jgi:quercetin dioxygenase-like cupin family protein